MPNKTVLIIDDDTHTNAMLADTLKMENYEVISAYSGEEALELLQRKQVDLILLDLLLPGLKGWMVAEELKKNEKTANIPIMVLSILSPEDTNLAKEHSNVSGYVCKPFDMDHLMGEIKKTVI